MLTLLPLCYQKPATIISMPDQRSDDVNIIFIDARRVDDRVSPHCSPGGEMIAQKFVFTRDFPKAWNNPVYFQLRKISCGCKDQARFCPPGEKCGLARIAHQGGEMIAQALTHC
jgi:hypothetical protein